MAAEPIEYKKNLLIEPVPNSSFWRVAFQGGGEVPDMVKGLFTSMKRAQDAVDRMYVVKSKPRRRTQATAEA